MQCGIEGNPQRARDLHNRCIFSDRRGPCAPSCTKAVDARSCEGDCGLGSVSMLVVCMLTVTPRGQVPTRLFLNQRSSAITGMENVCSLKKGLAWVACWCATKKVKRPAARRLGWVEHCKCHRANLHTITAPVKTLKEDLRTDCSCCES